MIVKGFLGSRNVNEYDILLNGEPFNLNTANVVKVEVVVEGVTIDSVNEPDSIWFTGTKIFIKWGHIEKPATKAGYSPSIYGYMVNDEEGELIYGPGAAENISLTLVEDERPQ